MAYSDKVIDHYNNPRNVGQMDKISAEVGTGLVGAPECGDVMRLQIRVNPETQVIEEAKFKTFGCGSAIASSSLATEWVKGKTVDEAMEIKNTDIVKELALPPVKIHCSVLAEDAIRAAIGDWKKKNGVDRRRPLCAAGCREVTEANGRSKAAWKILSCSTEPLLRPRSRAFSVTERAVRRIRSAMAKEGISPEQGGLRLGIMGGGCSGLSYSIRFDTQPRERDRIYTFEDVRVFVDPKSFIYLNGMVLDYEETLMRQGFNFINPNSQQVLRLRFVLLLLTPAAGAGGPFHHDDC